MQKSNPSLTLAKKRLDINALYSDDSLFDTFDFKSSFRNKINQKEIKDDFIYNKSFEDSDMCQFNGFNKALIGINLKKQDLNLNFCEDPHITNKILMKKIGSQYFNNDLKNKIVKYWWSLSNMILFEYEPKCSSGNDKDNKALKLNSKNNIPYLYYNDYNNIFGDKCRFILRKTILPIRYINHVSVVIKDNKLLKKMKRKNRIIIMNDINIEQKKLLNKGLKQKNIKK
jgi:hypothetical protein